MAKEINYHLVEKTVYHIDYHQFLKLLIGNDEKINHEELSKGNPVIKALFYTVTSHLGNGEEIKNKYFRDPTKQSLLTKLPILSSPRLLTFEVGLIPDRERLLKVYPFLERYFKKTGDIYDIFEETNYFYADVNTIFKMEALKQISKTNAEERNIKFVTRLDETEMIDIINACKADKAKGGYFEKIGYVVIHGEEDRRDLNGNKYLWVQTGVGSLVLDSYKITDYEMETKPTFNHPADLTKELRAALAKRFGEEYITSLLSHNISLAQEEAEQLRLSLTEQVKKPAL